MKFKLVILNLVFMSSAFAGEREGGGGTILAAEFATTGRQAIEILGLGDSTIDITGIKESIREVRVIPMDKICYQDATLGIEYCEDAHYDAANNNILLDFKRWNQMSCKDKLVLSVHEFSRAAGLEGEDYKYSGRFIYQKIAQCSDPYTVDCADLKVMINRQIDLLCERLSLASRDR